MTIVNSKRTMTMEKITEIDRKYMGLNVNNYMAKYFLITNNLGEVCSAIMQAPLQCYLIPVFTDFSRVANNYLVPTCYR